MTKSLNLMTLAVYLCSIMIGMQIPPMAAAVAVPEPEIAAKTMQARITTMPNPPVLFPTSVSANPISLFAIPPVAISSPAIIKNETASSEKLSAVP